ncbi:MAG: acetylornithine/succinylornithine family transaminase [Oscillospiraceae bacterium]
MNSQEIKALDAQYVLPTYARFDLCLMEGKGCRAKDPEGKSYLDFSSGIGVNSLGWADSAWAAAVAHQAATLQHSSNLYYTLPGTQLAEVLCQRTGMDKVFFCNSGAEANEGAIKAARKYSRDKYGEGRAVIITLENSFHGRTMATLTATGQDQFHQHFHPFLPGFVHVPAGDIPALKAALASDVCAVMLEPIQGEGGVVPLDEGYLKELGALCKSRDVLVIADEVQTGVGRTGAFLASEKTALAPDIVSLAKGLGGGLPLGAVLLAKSCSGALGKGDHATTFGANPVCCAGAQVVVDRLTDDFLAGVAQKGALLKELLATLPGVEAVSGDGLMLGVCFAPPLAAADVLNAAMENGLLCLLAKDRLRLLPPLTITEDELREGVAILKKTLEALA